MARKIVAGDEEDAGSVESVFEQARQVAAEAEALLVDADWHPPEPEPAIGEAEPVAGGMDEGREEAPELQQSLFLWAEFMAGEQGRAAEAPAARRGSDAVALRVGA